MDATLMGRKPGRILDLGCGPGLYAERLARRGHTCVGIDYSPASIDYARQTAQQEALACTYRCQDIRQADFGTGFDLAMLIFGEYNVFCPADARSILQKTRQALQPAGRLLLEVHSFETLYRMGHAPATWYTTQKGLFADQPHLLLEESFWSPESQAVTNRYFRIDAATGAVRRYAASYQAYSEEGYRNLLAETGFTMDHNYPALGDVATDGSSEFIAITANLR
jgi:SAM-dependent methyltransferase